MAGKATFQKIDKISRTYAQALWGAARDSQEKLSDQAALSIDSPERVIYQQLDAFVGALLQEGSGAAMKFLASPSLSLDEKLALLESWNAKFSLHPVLKKFLGVLLSKGRIRQLPGIFKAFQKIIEAQQNIVRGDVASVDLLESQVQKNLESALSQMMAKQVVLEPLLQPELLGGVVIRLEDKVYDSSLRSKLQSLKKALEVS